MTSTGELPDLLLPSEVAGLFKVHVKTVNRWAREGRLPSTWTVGGRRRFLAGPVRELLERGWDGWEEA
nr:helix-turn-helix domain-containing protein [Allonocardiopsis opalescens]